MEEHSLAQRAIAEVIGTGLLVFVGAGSVPAILLLEGGSKAPFSGADLGMISFAFGLIVIAMVYTIGKVSGCHINPAVTFALASTKRFPWREVPAYWTAQVVGGILGAFAIWATFADRGRFFAAVAGWSANEQQAAPTGCAARSFSRGRR